ncbi:MAG: hypothetical protein U9R79_08125 [Armatimonadota bacterium]|nr:hypothetical protein [Armatimonadota bacterium]
MVAAAALTALALLGGCMFIDGQFAMAPDGSVDARLEAGVLKSMAERGEGDFTTDLGSELAEGKWQEEEYDRGQWHVKAMVGHAGPGESLFTEDAEVAPEFSSTTHLLTTRYEFAMQFPEEKLEAAFSSGPPAAGEAEGEQAEGETEEEDEQAEDEMQMEINEQMQEAFGQMMTMMMSSGDAGLRFSVQLPGEVVESTGELVGPGRVAWRMDLTAEEPPFTRLHAVSALPNWPNVGRLGGELVEAGRWELVPVLIAAVRRGVVPDPAVDQPMEAEMDAQLYATILEIMVALDQAVGEANADAIMVALGLDKADVDPAFVQEVAEKATREGFAASIDQDVTEQVLDELRGG